MRLWTAAACAAAIGLIGGSARAFTITPTYYDGAGQTWTQTEEDVVEAAIQSWTSRLAIPSGPQDVGMAFEFIHGNGELAQWTGSPVSTPTGSFVTTPGINHVIDINVDLMDTSLSNHLIFTLGDFPFADWDALSVLRHEIGHALGFNTIFDNAAGDSLWQQHVTVSGGDATFDAGGLNLALDGPGDIVHFAGDGQIADDLMSAYLPNGTRKDVSMADLQALALTYGYVIIPEPATAGMLAAGLGAMLLRRRARR